MKLGNNPLHPRSNCSYYLALARDSHVASASSNQDPAAFDFRLKESVQSGVKEINNKNEMNSNLVLSVFLVSDNCGFLTKRNMLFVCCPLNLGAVSVDEVHVGVDRLAEWEVKQ